MLTLYWQRVPLRGSACQHSVVRNYQLPNEGAERQAIGDRVVLHQQQLMAGMCRTSKRWLAASGALNLLLLLTAGLAYPYAARRYAALLG